MRPRLKQAGSVGQNNVSRRANTLYRPKHDKQNKVTRIGFDVSIKLTKFPLGQSANKNIALYIFACRR